MSHKINPIVFRLGVSKNWDSVWGSQFNFSELLHEDFFIRLYLIKIIEKHLGFVHSCIIKRSNLVVFISLNILYFPKRPQPLVDSKVITSLINYQTSLTKNLNTIIKSTCILKISNYRKVFKKVSLKVQIKNTYHPYFLLLPFLKYVTFLGNASLLVRYLVLQTQKNYRHNSFFTFLQNFLTLKKLPNCLGLKIKYKGRINGSQRKKQKKFIIGRVPLSTLQLKIDYAQQHAFTKYGVIGIKVWLNCKIQVTPFRYSKRNFQTCLLLKQKTYKLVFLKKYYGITLSNKYKKSKTT